MKVSSAKATVWPQVYYNFLWRYRQLKQQFDLKSHEASLFEDRLKQSTHHQQLEELEDLKQSIGMTFSIIGITFTCSLMDTINSIINKLKYISGKVIQRTSRFTCYPASFFKRMKCDMMSVTIPAIDLKLFMIIQQLDDWNIHQYLLIQAIHFFLIWAIRFLKWFSTDKYKEAVYKK